MTTLVSLAVAAVEHREDRLVTSGVADAVEAASKQAVAWVISSDAVSADRLRTQLKNALGDQQLTGDSELTVPDTDSTETDREQLTAAIQRATDEELSLSTKACQQLATAFLSAFQRQLCEPIDDDHAVDSPIQRLGDSVLRERSFDEAESYYQFGVRCAREIGTESAEAAGLRSLGNVALQRDDLETAEDYHRQSLEITREANLQSIEADSLASLGTIEANRGYAKTAETYLTESLDLKRLVGDRLGEATCLASLGTVAERKAAYETATDRYAEALALFSADEHRERLQTLQGLVDSNRALGDQVAAVEYCEQGLELLASTDGADLSDHESYRHWFESMYAQLTGGRAALEELYLSALSNLRDDNIQVALELLEGLWAARDTADSSDAFELCLRAGVGFAAVHLLASDEATDASRGAILAEISTQRDRLSEPASALFAFVSTDGNDGREISTASIDEPTGVDDLERLAYAAVLDGLRSSPPPATLYSKALTGIARDNRGVKRVLRLSLAAWNQRERVGDTRSVVGAGLLVEAHRELFDVALSVDRRAVFEAATETEGLSEPLQALFERLETGSTNWLADPIDSPADDGPLSLSEAEHLAVDRILTRLAG